jgi:large subunit ribosomal protein L9
MQIILLERIAGLGQMGDEVRVRDGYARNYLLPQGKALRANETNRKQFESRRSQLEARNLERKNEAAAIAEKLDGQSYILVRQAAETGQLYGSVTPRDLADAITEAGFTIARSQVVLSHPIKSIGLHSIAIALHPDVTATITANVARSPDEAERQARGEDLTMPEAEAEQEQGGGAASAGGEAEQKGPVEEKA